MLSLPISKDALISDLECPVSFPKSLLISAPQECNASDKKAIDGQGNKVADINKEINSLGKEIFEIKITVNENKEADDKNQAAVNKKLQDIFSAKGNVNEQLNNLLYLLTNAEVGIQFNTTTK